jgi:hypothetical protein
VPVLDGVWVGVLVGDSVAVLVELGVRVPELDGVPVCVGDSDCVLVVDGVGVCENDADGVFDGELDGD